MAALRIAKAARGHYSPWLTRLWLYPQVSASGRSAAAMADPQPSAQSADPAEAQRLAALRRYQILDTPPEAEFDDIVKLAAQICDAPIALISLIDKRRQWFKAKHGTDLSETPLSMSICATALDKPGVVELPDTTADARSRDNPLVIGETHLRFYAGARIETPDGVPLGMLCVLDTKPRRLTETQRFALQVLARQVMNQLELRRANLALETRVAAEILERDRMWLISRDLMAVAQRDSALIAVNPAWTDILGWGIGDLIGRKGADLVHPEDREGTVTEVQIGSGGRTLIFEKRFRHRDGSYRNLAWRSIVVDGIIYGIGRDVTDENAASERLRQSQRMEALGQLTGGVAHDFNNLLTVIIGNLEALQRGAAGTPMRRSADRAMQGVERAVSLTQRLLAFSRQQSLAPKTVALNDLLSSMSDMLTRTLGAPIKIETRLAPDLWPVHVDAHELENSVLNLAVNARDAMPKGGNLTIKTANVTLADGKAAEMQLAPGDYVRIAVADTGSGMPKAVLAKAFEPFFTTKKMGKGTGLGLAQLYGFVRQSGGQATIDSVEGNGTVVTLYLPRRRGD
jgi:PAS domain S-box-containing protein